MKTNTEAERGDAYPCVNCGDYCRWGAGHEVENDVTHESVWLCCPCFEKSVLDYIAATRNPNHEPPPDP